MIDDPIAPGDLTVYGTRVYFRPSSGEIVHVHQLVGHAGDPLDAARVAEELDAFAAALAEREGEVDFLAVEEGELNRDAPVVGVDVGARSLVRG